MDEERPFADVVLRAGGFSIPELKWRELLFIGALRAEAGAYVRDPSRPLPAFCKPDLFPEGVRFSVGAAGKRVLIQRVN
jgi:hypothetical protein